MSESWDISDPASPRKRNLDWRLFILLLVVVIVTAMFTAEFVANLLF